MVVLTHSRVFGAFISIFFCIIPFQFCLGLSDSKHSGISSISTIGETGTTQTQQQQERSKMTTTTYLITGASSGIGLEFVKQLSDRPGTHVIATCRKKTSSATGVDHISAIQAAEGSHITIVEGIDVTSDSCKDAILEGLAAAKCDTVDVVVHNAGGLGSAGLGTQSFENVTSEMMLHTVNLNGIGPMRIQQALMAKGIMGQEGGKVVLITSGMGSIGDNGSGGYYAYRSSKAYANMIFKSMACDFKPKGISVMAIAPSFVATEFGGAGKEQLEKMGAIPVETSVGQMVQAMDELNLETTGRYMTVNKNGNAPREFPGGW